MIETENKSIMVDEVDKKLLNMLQKNAVLTNKQIAAELNLTVTPVYERIKKLKKNGVITGIRATVDPKLVGKQLMVFCEVSVANHKKEHLDQFEKEAKAIFANTILGKDGLAIELPMNKRPK